MKKITTILTIVLLQTATLFANNENDTLSKQKQCFYDAKTEIENMLSGKIPLDYERAVFITENAYWNNEVEYSLFKSAIDFHARNIKNLAETNRNESTQNFKATLLETEVQKREKYQNLLYNWAIYTYLTDTTILKTTLNDKNYIFQHLPYEYSYSDPMGVLDWKNSQVFNLLDNDIANCYAMTSFFKLLAERLKTDANIGVAPGHVYITHIDQKGTHYNIELANRAFPGAGSIMTLTYTPVEAVRNGIAMRTLDLKQSVALCLIYLAKGYEYKFDTKTDDFLYQCAESTLKYDSLNLNAMLLKAEIFEEKIVISNKTVSQLQTVKEFKEYQNLIVSLFEKGYREMPLDMKNLIINRLQKDSLGLILTDHTPKGFQSINPKDDRYATLSWGLFDEVHEPKLIEQYGRTLLNTKTKKIAKFVTADSLYNKYPIDPVVFAWQIDPLASKYPNMSPYAAFANNPIMYIDYDGQEPIKPFVGTVSQFVTLLNNSTRKVGMYTGSSAHNYMMSLGNTEFKWSQMRPVPTQTGYFNQKVGRYIYTEKGGWVDMAHFMFYAGKAYSYKQEQIQAQEMIKSESFSKLTPEAQMYYLKKASMSPAGEAVQDGYTQEMTDKYAAKHSAYSYEDLPSDKFGADFAVNYFDPNSKLTFGEQLQNYMNNVLKATTPENAPNYENLPVSEPDEPTRTNKTTTPVYTNSNP